MDIFLSSTERQFYGMIIYVMWAIGLAITGAQKSKDEGNITVRNIASIIFSFYFFYNYEKFIGTYMGPMKIMSLAEPLSSLLAIMLTIIAVSYAVYSDTRQGLKVGILASFENFAKTESYVDRVLIAFNITPIIFTYIFTVSLTYFILVIVVHAILF